MTHCFWSRNENKLVTVVLYFEILQKLGGGVNIRKLNIKINICIIAYLRQMLSPDS